MKSHTLLFAVAFLTAWLLSSCHRGTSDEDTSSVHIDVQLDKLQPVSFEDIQTDFADIYDEKYWVINDSLVLIENKQGKGNFIDVANLNTGNRTGAFFPFGEGPDEMLFCGIEYDGNSIIATDFIRSRFSQFTAGDLASATFTPEYIEIPRGPIYTSLPRLINDSILLINPLRYINKTFGIEQTEPRFLYVAKNTPNNFYDISGLLNTANVGQVISALNPADGKLWLASRDKSEIEIYNPEHQLIKTLYIPSDVSGDPAIRINENKMGREITFDRIITSAFTHISIDCEDSSIYLILVGKVLHPGEYGVKNGVYLLHFDGNGNYLNGAYSPQYIRALSVCDGTIYATIHDEEDNPKLVKVIMPL